MKKLSILLMFSFMGVSIAALSQSDTEINPGLEHLISKEELTQLKKDNPKEYNYLVYTLENGWYVTDFPKEKGKSGQIGDISIDDMENINIYELGLDIKMKDYQYFRINGGDKMLVIRSREHIVQLLQQK